MRRRIVYYDKLNDSYIVSDEYREGQDNDGFMESIGSVNNLLDFMSVLSKVGAYYRDGDDALPGVRMHVAHNRKELIDLLDDLNEVYQVGESHGAKLVSAVDIYPKQRLFYDGKEVKDENTFIYDDAKVGDLVTQAVVDNAMNCVPPATMSADCAQMGEPYSCKLDTKTDTWRVIYPTFRKIGGKFPNGIWEYCGNCFRGENTERWHNLKYC